MKDDFAIGYFNAKDNAVGVADAYRLLARKSSRQRVEPEGRREGI